jgi:hypothetical protein
VRQDKSQRQLLFLTIDQNNNSGKGKEGKGKGKGKRKKDFPSFFPTFLRFSKSHKSTLMSNINDELDWIGLDWIGLDWDIIESGEIEGNPTLKCQGNPSPLLPGTSWTSQSCLVNPQINYQSENYYQLVNLSLCQFWKQRFSWRIRYFPWTRTSKIFLTFETFETFQNLRDVLPSSSQPASLTLNQASWFFFPFSFSLSRSLWHTPNGIPSSFRNDEPWPSFDSASTRHFSGSALWSSSFDGKGNGGG